MKNPQDNANALPALLRAAGGVDTLETNSLCCAAAGIIASSSATAEALIPHEKLRGAALADATLNAQQRPLAQPAVGYTRHLGEVNPAPNPAEQRQDVDVALAHCPFCGQQDAFVEQLDSDASVVVCQGRISEHSACLARGPVGVQQDDCEDQPGYDKAIEEWNRRAAVLSASPTPTPANCCNCGACPAGCVATQRASV